MASRIHHWHGSAVTSYLSNCVQFTVFKNHISDDLIIDTGVPQGSVLIPLLFNIYTKDTSNGSNCFQIIQCADDTAVEGNFSVQNIDGSSISFSNDCQHTVSVD